MIKTLRVLVCSLALAGAASSQDPQTRGTIDNEQQRYQRMFELQRQRLGVEANQWPRFRETLTEIEAFLEAYRQANADLYNAENDWAGAGFYVFFEPPSYGTPEQYQAERQRTLGLLENWQGRGFFELTADLASIEGVVSPPRQPEQPPELALGSIRELARAQHARLHVAGERGDDADRVRAFVELLATHRTIAWSGELMEFIVALDGAQESCKHLLASLMRDPPSDERWLVDADHAIEERLQDGWPPSDALLAAIRDAHLEFLQLTYSDDGHGGGSFLVEEYDQQPWLLGNAIDDYDGPFADRPAAVAWLERHCKLLQPCAQASGQDFVDAEQAVQTHANPVGPSIPMAIDVTPVSLHVIMEWREFQVWSAGTRVVLTIERHRRANGGAVPQSLEQLGDLLPKELRHDPLSGEPWLYLPTPVTTTEYGLDLLPDAHAWPYQLWSRALPGHKQATNRNNERGVDLPRGLLITLPAQAAQYDEP